jgi:hypothetical protein
MRPRHLLALVLAFAGSARAAGSLNVVTAVEVKDEGAAVVLQVTGSRPPNFTTFSMADPPRFVIDLSEARFQGVPEDMVVRDGVVNLVKNLSYGSDATSIARIMVAFQLDVDPPDVQAAGNTLVVRIAKPAGAAAAVATDDGAKAREAEQKARKAQEEAARAAAEAKAQEEAARAAAEAKARVDVEKAEAAKEAAAAAQARADVEKAEAAKDAAAAEKSRGGAQSAAAARAADEKERQGAVARAEEEAQARARAEADAREVEAQARADEERKAKEDADARAAAEARAASERELAATNAKTAVLDEAPSRAPAAAEPAAPEATPAIADAPAVAAHASADVLDIGAPRAQLREVGFRQLPGASRVYVRTSVTPRFTIQDVGENVIRVELENTRATRRNDLRHLDTSFFPSAVAVVTPARRGASYVLDIKLRERVPYQQRIEGNMLAIDFERPAAPGALPVAGPAGTMPADGGAEPVPAALEGEAPEAAPAAN